jgi:hypothetical protein
MFLGSLYPVPPLPLTRSPLNSLNPPVQRQQWPQAFTPGNEPSTFSCELQAGMQTSATALACSSEQSRFLRLALLDSEYTNAWFSLTPVECALVRKGEGVGYIVTLNLRRKFDGIRGVSGQSEFLDRDIRGKNSNLTRYPSRRREARAAAIRDIIP